MRATHHAYRAAGSSVRFCLCTSPRPRQHVRACQSSRLRTIPAASFVEEPSSMRRHLRWVHGAKACLANKYHIHLIRVMAFEDQQPNENGTNSLFRSRDWPLLSIVSIYS